MTMVGQREQWPNKARMCKQIEEGLLNKPYPEIKVERPSGDLCLALILLTYFSLCLYFFIYFWNTTTNK
jgi:hypothetical protein